MKDPMFCPNAADTHLIWVGYPDVAAPDRFAIPDAATRIVYMYVPLDVACRWQACGPRDKRTLELCFHVTPEHDARLAATRNKYVPMAKRSLDLWDHAPRGNGERSEKAPNPVKPAA
jgi:hypothetical protein